MSPNGNEPYAPLLKRDELQHASFPAQFFARCCGMAAPELAALWARLLVHLGPRLPVPQRAMMDALVAGVLRRKGKGDDLDFGSARDAPWRTDPASPTAEPTLVSRIWRAVADDVARDGAVEDPRRVIVGVRTVEDDEEGNPRGHAQHLALTLIRRDGQGVVFPSHRTAPFLLDDDMLLSGQEALRSLAILDDRFQLSGFDVRWEIIGLTRELWGSSMRSAFSVGLAILLIKDSGSFAVASVG